MAALRPDGRIDRRAVMSLAHRIHRRSGAPWSLCLRESWRINKEASRRRDVERETFVGVMGSPIPATALIDHMAPKPADAYL